MSKKQLYRLFEILPGLSAWSTFILAIPLAIYLPKIFVSIMIVYAIYWLYKTVIMSYRMLLGYVKFKRSLKIDWLQKIKDEVTNKDWRDIYHLVIVPTYKEDVKILISSIESVINSDYPKDRIIYVLATEERDKENARSIAKHLTNTYKDKLFALLVTEHPANLVGEVKGKGANIYYSAKEVLKFIDQKKIPYENVVVTTMDADNLFDKKYPSCLSYTYLTTNEPINKSFQPIPMFFNNIWDVPLPMRLMAMGSSFWQMVVATQPHLLRNFSAHAQSLDALIKTDFWSKQTIVEDGHQFWRSYFALNGKHQVIPMFVPIYMDAVLAGNLVTTIKEQYLQKRRWSWGVSDIPYVFYNMIKSKNIPAGDRFYKSFLLFNSHFDWSTASIILAVVVWYPFIFSQTFMNSIYAYSFPRVYSTIFIMAWIGMIVTLILSTLLLPKHTGKKFPTLLYYIKEWLLTPILLPVTNIFLSSIPALESQTRLLFGRYLEYRVTVKSVNRSGIIRETK